MFEGVFALFEIACTLASLSLKEILCLLCLLAGFLLLIFNFWIGILIMSAGAIAWIYCIVSGIFNDSEESPDSSLGENHDGSAAADGPARVKTRRYQSPNLSYKRIYRIITAHYCNNSADTGGKCRWAKRRRMYPFPDN